MPIGEELPIYPLYLRGLFAAGVSIGLATERMWSEESALYDVERRALARAGSKRRREFTAGRRCAHALLRELGRNDVAIPVGAGGMPVWPPGVVGSIAHCADRCVVAVASRERFVSVGVDVEPAGPLRKELVGLVCTDAEQRGGAGWSRRQADWSKIIFCAKESFYKCYFPVAGEVIDFLDVEVRIDITRQRFIAALRGDAVASAAGRRELVGRHRHGDGHLYTAVAIEAV